MATSSMIKPCNTCGDIGVVEAIVVCCECNVVREHLYCMREVTMEMPEWWCCDECEQNKLSSPSPKTIENEPKTQKLSIILQQIASVKESEPKILSPSQLGIKEKRVTKGKTQYITYDEAVKLSSGGSVKPNIRKEFGSQSRKSNSLTPAHVLQRSTGLKGSQTKADVEAAGKPNLTMLAMAEQETIHDLPVSEMHDPYIPSFNSYWKGCFNLPDGSQEFNETFRGHLPSKTHYKVYEATKKLPENISFELVSNCEIRTEIFPADTDDIGLYFFPMSTTRSERGIPIIDFIWRNDLALKSNVENLELFVLSSRVLPAHAQEFQGNYFLWGVFRRRKIAKKVADTSLLTVTNCALCTDAPPGFERMCRHTTKRKPCADVPPGFKRICR